MSDIHVTVKFFAAFQEIAAASEMSLTLPPNSRVLTVFESLVARYPPFADWRSLLRYAVNLEFVEPDRPLQDGDVVALIPPVSGG